MTDEVSDMEANGQSWLADLAEELPTRRLASLAELTIPTVVRECDLWAGRAPLSAWERRDNAKSLLEDWKSAESDAGPAVQGLLSVPIMRLTSSLKAVVSAAKSDRPAKVAALGVAVEEVLSQLVVAGTRNAAWADVVGAARATDADVLTVAHRVALLIALLDLCGADPGDAMQRMRLQLNPPPGLIGRVPDLPSAAATDDARIAACAAIVTAEPRSGRCVAWLSFGDARLAQGHQNVGPVFLIESDWAIPNAVSPQGQDFPHRKELLRVLDHAPHTRDRDFAASPLYEVLARVDLGHRPTYRALDDAAAMVEVLLGVVVNRSGAPSWHREELSCLLVDDAVGALAFGPHGRVDSDEVDHYGQNGAADALARYGPEMGQLLSAGPLPGELSEALRLIGEAGQVDSRENALRRTATIAEQTVVVLQATAVEHIAAFGGMPEHDHDQTLLTGWPLARWHQQVRGAVYEGLRGLGGGANPVFLEIAPRGLDGVISLTAAYRRRNELVAATQGRFHRSRAARLLSSVGDATSCSELLASFEAEAELVNARLRRSRNALVHGNPVTVDTIASVRELCRYKVDTALEVAIQSIVEGVPLKQLLAERSDRERRDRESIDAGTFLFAIWSQPK